MPNKSKFERGYRGHYPQINESGLYYCYKCEKFKPESEFDNSPDKWFRNGKDTRCKQCKKIQYDKRRIQNRGRLDLEGLLISRWYGARDRAKRKEIPFLLSIEDLKDLWIKQNGKCAISNIDMTFEFYTGRVFTNVSIDRIDSNLGYTKDNIQLVCMAVNQMKSDLSLDELYFFCDSIIKNAARWKKTGPKKNK